MICGLFAAVAAAAWTQVPPASSPTPFPSPPAARSASPAVAPSPPSLSPTATPTPPSPLPPGGPPLRITESPSLSVLELPAENPFGAKVDSPAAFNGKPAFTELPLAAPFYAALHVDRSGKVVESRLVRDPIPSLSAESKKSFDRWSFDPARKGGQPVETWASIRLDLAAEIRAPKLEHFGLTPVTPASPIPAPFAWGSDSSWYERVNAAPIPEGIVPVEQVDVLATPRKTKWDADSYKGPFSCRFWARVNAGGRIERAIVIQISEPLLIGYFRQQMSTWQLKPAVIAGQPADSWNELALTGQIGYSTEVKQIANLRKTILTNP